MQEAFIHLKEVTTAFELSFAQAFGPAIGKGSAGDHPASEADRRRVQGRVRR